MVILIAEDDDGHVELIREGLEEAGLCNTVLHFVNSEEYTKFAET